MDGFSLKWPVSRPREERIGSAVPFVELPIIVAICNVLKLCTNLVHHLSFIIFASRKNFYGCSKQQRIQGQPAQYFDLARNNDVVITSRSHGSYRLVPVAESDTLIDKATLDAKIHQGIADYESGRVHRMNEGESTEDFLGRMINEA